MRDQPQAHRTALGEEVIEIVGSVYATESCSTEEIAQAGLREGDKVRASVEAIGLVAVLVDGIEPRHADDTDPAWSQGIAELRDHIERARKVLEHMVGHHAIVRVIVRDGRQALVAVEGQIVSGFDPGGLPSSLSERVEPRADTAAEVKDASRAVRDQCVKARDERFAGAALGLAGLQLRSGLVVRRPLSSRAVITRQSLGGRLRPRKEQIAGTAAVCSDAWRQRPRLRRDEAAGARWALHSKAA